jgi:dienelactone hydrolase
MTGLSPEESRDLLRKLSGFGVPAHLALISRTLVREQAQTRIERLDLVRADGQAIRGFLCRPAGRGPFPVILYPHAHGHAYRIGAEELIAGRPALIDPPYGFALSARGIASLAIDLPCFGERNCESESAAAKRHLWHGGTLFGEMLSDLAGSLDLIEALGEFDPGRIGMLGISMGGTLAYWLGALDPRIRALTQLCVLADMTQLIASRAHDQHGPYLTVPHLVRHISTGAIAGLVAPRPQLVCLGADDPLTPSEARERAIADARAAYAAAGTPDRFDIHLEAGTGHRETPAMRARVLAFFEAHL